MSHSAKSESEIEKKTVRVHCKLGIRARSAKKQLIKFAFYTKDYGTCDRDPDLAGSHAVTLYDTGV